MATTMISNLQSTSTFPGSDLRTTRLLIQEETSTDGASSLSAGMSSNPITPVNGKGCLESEVLKFQVEVKTSTSGVDEGNGKIRKSSNHVFQHHQQQTLDMGRHQVKFDAKKQQIWPKKNVVFDLGGVLLRWDGSNLGDFISPKLFAHMLQDSVWNEYETGKLTSKEAYERLAERFSVSEEAIEKALEFARIGLVPIPEVMELLRQLSSPGLGAGDGDSSPQFRLFCMSNIPLEEFLFLETRYPKLWPSFEQVFTSAQVGLRKPELRFFQHVLDAAHLDPSDTLLVDDTLENCIAARSLGLAAVCFSQRELPSAMKKIMFELRGEEQRLRAARDYLDRARESPDREQLLSVALNVREGDEQLLRDHFSEFLLAEMTADPAFLPMQNPPESGELFFTPEDKVSSSKWLLYPLPADLDTTSVGLSAMHALGRVDRAFVEGVAREMLGFGY